MLKGGKVVGKGTYGCVYNPPMKCKGESIRETNTISKLMETSEAVKEVTEMSVIDDIDPEYEFHVELRRICDPGVPIKGVDYRVGADGKIINKCPIIDDIFKGRTMSSISTELNKKNLKLVKYEDGGQNLATFIGNEIEGLTDDAMKSNFFLRLFLSMENLFKGLVVMGRHEFCHFDIKLENIVIKPHDDGNMFTLKYIDFGMSRSFKEIPVRGVFKNSYFVWPLETMIFVPDVYNSIASSTTQDNMLSAFKRSFSSKIAAQTIDTRTMDPYTKTIEDRTVFANYLRDINGEGGPKKDKLEMFNEMTSKIDTFSLGIVLLECWANILKIYFYNNDATDVLLDTFTHREIFDEIQELILNMIRSYYGVRFNSEQAYTKYLSIKSLILGKAEFNALRVSSVSVLSGMKTRLSERSPDITDTNGLTGKKQTRRRTKIMKQASKSSKQTRKRKVHIKDTPQIFEITPHTMRSNTDMKDKPGVASGKKPTTRGTFFSKYISPLSDSESDSDSEEYGDVTSAFPRRTTQLSYADFAAKQKQGIQQKPKKQPDYKNVIIPDSDTDTEDDTDPDTPLIIGKTILSSKPTKKMDKHAQESRARIEAEKDKLLKREYATNFTRLGRFNIPTMPSEIE